MTSRLQRHQNRVRNGGGSSAANVSGGYDAVVRNSLGLATRFWGDQINQGRRVANQLLDGTYSVAAFDQDLRTWLDRMLRLPREVGAIGMGFLDGIASGPMSGASSGVAVEVESARRTQATVQFASTASGFVPSILPLCAADRSVAPIANARFVVKQGTRLVLAVRIPDDQPLGAYSAAIVDAQTQEPGGFVTLKVLE